MAAQVSSVALVAVLIFSGRVDRLLFRGQPDQRKNRVDATATPAFSPWRRPRPSAFQRSHLRWPCRHLLSRESENSVTNSKSLQGLAPNPWSWAGSVFGSGRFAGLAGSSAILASSVLFSFSGVDLAFGAAGLAAVPVSFASAPRLPRRGAARPQLGWCDRLLARVSLGILRLRASPPFSASSGGRDVAAAAV